MKILVTGGSGLVGNAIKSITDSNYNYNKNHTVIDEFVYINSYQCNLTDLRQTQQLFEREQPDCVIHLAAYVGGLFKNMNYKVDMYEKNILINHNVLKCCHDYNVRKVVSCLSTCIFPDKTTYPINEQMLHNGPPHSSNDAYAYAKRMLEVQSTAYQEQYGDNFICVIPTNIYGEYDNFSIDNGHVIPSLIHKCYLAKESCNPFVVCGTGSSLRQFIYSTDLAKLMLWTLYKYTEKEPIILSANEEQEISIGQIADIIAKEFQYAHNIRYDTSYSDGQFKKTADNGKLMKLYPNFEFTDIRSGIKNTVQWFKNNYDSCRK